MYHLFVISKVFGRICLGTGYPSIEDAKEYLANNNWDGYYTGLVAVIEQDSVAEPIDSWIIQ